MKGVGVGRFSALCRAAGAPPAATQADSGVRVCVKRHILLELQWQDRRGRFRHIVLSPQGPMRVLGAFGIVVLFALALVGASSSKSNRKPAPVGVDTLWRENSELKARQDTLRELAFDLSQQLYWRLEHGRRMARLVDTPGRVWADQCPRPPARDAGDEAILAWLSEQATRLEAVGNNFTADWVEQGEARASLRAPVNGGPVLYVADMGPTRQ
jgi:hypothetical protein